MVSLITGSIFLAAFMYAIWLVGSHVVAWLAHRDVTRAAGLRDGQFNGGPSQQTLDLFPDAPIRAPANRYLRRVYLKGVKDGIARRPTWLHRP